MQSWELAYSNSFSQKKEESSSDLSIKSVGMESGERKLRISRNSKLRGVNAVKDKSQTVAKE
jgi:hypothetical protein